MNPILGGAACLVPAFDRPGPSPLGYIMFSPLEMTPTEACQLRMQLTSELRHVRMLLSRIDTL